MMVKHGLAYALARGLPALVSFAAIAIYTRFLEPAEYGRYAVAIATIGVAQMVAFLWLQLGLLRFVAAYRGAPERLLASALAGFVVVALVIGLAALGLVWRLDDPAMQQFVLIGCALVVVDALSEMQLRLANARLQPVHYARLALTRAIVALAVGFGLVRAGMGGEGVLIGLLAGAAAAAALPSFRTFRDCRPRDVDPVILKRLFLYGAPLVVTIALDYVLFTADRLLIARLIGIDAAGTYAVGHDLTNYLLGTILVIVNLAAYPLAVRAYEEGGMAKAVPMLRQNLILLWGLALPAAAGMALLAGNIAGVVTGGAFSAGAASVMPIIALAVLIQKTRTFHFDLAFQLSAKVGIQAGISAAAAIVNIVLNLWTIPAFGAPGAAWATVVASALALTLSISLGRRRLALPVPTADLAKIALATLVMAVCVWPLRDLDGLASLVVQVVTGGAVYLGAAWLLDIGGMRHTARLPFGLSRGRLAT